MTGDVVNAVPVGGDGAKEEVAHVLVFRLVVGGVSNALLLGVLLLGDDQGWVAHRPLACLVKTLGFFVLLVAKLLDKNRLELS